MVYLSYMRIGVFDSGIGGKAVAEKLQDMIPSAEIISIDDHEHVPYGTRSEKQIIELTESALQPLIKHHCDAIVIACNTATTVAIGYLREQYPTIKFIGIEPMIKPAAAMTKTRSIAVLATPRTLQSKRYNELKRTWAKDITIHEPDCSDWASLIETGSDNSIAIDQTIKPLIAANVDVIVLGCTHYHLIKQQIIDSAGPDVTILEPTDAIAYRITDLLS